MTTDGLYERLVAYVGCPAAVAGEGRDPVNTPMIRHWCEAMGHPVPPDGTAPAPMLQVWTMRGLSGPGDTGGGGSRAGAYDELLTLLDEAGCTAVVATDCEQEYLRPLRPGDRITFDAVIESVSPRKATRLGSGYFVTTRMDLRADGELAGRHRFRILKYAPAGTPGDRPRRPRPVVNRDNAGYWEGVERHELLIQRCSSCGTLRLPWLPGCNSCGSGAWDTLPACGRGTVFSHVVVHHPPFPAFDPPYAVALVELAEGVRVLGGVVGVPYEKVRIGMPVTLEFRHADGEPAVPVFRAEV
ncbi:OB-fold domain-containing protein [Streptomyces sp. NPDC026673]|uniref:Zn-ribbon domain-containing OB-fold protein n=1 Tax=Streptomyces sp. NPDC026673 TaxID=3155724 RepID=UPI0033C4FCE2